MSSSEDPERIALENAGRVLMLRLLEAFPTFEETWTSHLAYWEQQSPGAFIDISSFAHFVDEELFLTGQTEEIKRVLSLLDELFLTGDEATRDLIGIGFIEDFQNTLSGRPDEYPTIIPLLPPTLLKVWKQIEQQWVGHSSLAEMIRAEAHQQTSRRSWADLLELRE